MNRLAALASVLAAAFLLSYVGARTPEPRRDGPDSRNFCAHCALADIAVIGRQPHPRRFSRQRGRAGIICSARMTALRARPPGCSARTAGRS